MIFETQPILAAAAGPIVSLLIFIGVFVAVVTYVFMVPKATWQGDARLPLDNACESPTNKEKSNVSNP